MDIRKPKIGLAGVMSTPFKGDKDSSYRNDYELLSELAQQYGFELHTIPAGIYNPDQAQAAAAELSEWEADFILLQNSSFASGDFIFPFTKGEALLGLWSVPEGPPAAGGSLPLNSFTSTNLYNSLIRRCAPGYQKPVKWFLGPVDGPFFSTRLLVTVQALRAIANLSGKQVALIGGVAPSFYNLAADEQKLYQRLGLRVVNIELEELLGRAESVAVERVSARAAEIQATAAQFDTTHSVALNKTARVYEGLQALAEEKNFQAAAISCWPRFQSEYQLAVCTMLGHFNQTGLVAACEGDVSAAASMFLLHLMTAGETVTLMDLASVDTQDDTILLWHCGPTAPSLADPKGARLQPLWLFDGQAPEPIGLHNDLVLRRGSATILGLTPDFESMLVLAGEIDPDKPSYTGSRGWMKNLHLNGRQITTAELVQTIMVSGYQHHYPLAYGSLSDAALELAGWLGIRSIPIEPYTHYVR